MFHCVDLSSRHNGCASLQFRLACVALLGFEMAKGNNQPVSQFSLGNIERCLAVQGGWHDLFERDAAKAALPDGSSGAVSVAAPIVSSHSSDRDAPPDVSSPRLAVTVTKPFGFDSAPKLTELTASSCNASPICKAALGLSQGLGPENRIARLGRQAVAGRLSDNQFAQVAPRQLDDVTRSCEAASDCRRPRKRVRKSSIVAEKRPVCVAMLWMMASRFRERWLTSRSKRAQGLLAALLLGRLDSRGDDADETCRRGSRSGSIQMLNQDVSRRPGN